jgi:hypothetical protein
MRADLAEELLWSYLGLLGDFLAYLVASPLLRAGHQSQVDRQARSGRQQGQQ